jgi:hypothetical protein
MAISLEDSKTGTINHRLCLRKHGGKAGRILKKLAETTQLISGKTEPGFWVAGKLQIMGSGPALLRGDCMTGGNSGRSGYLAGKRLLSPARLRLQSGFR